MPATQNAAKPTSPASLWLAEADRPVVLVVDDDPATRNHIASLMESAGWSVREARDGETALLLAREHIPELILLDLALPRMSGFEVLRTLRSWTDQPTRVVVVSAYAALVRLPDMRLADGLIAKPVGAEELLAEVNRTTWRQAAVVPRRTVA